MRSSPYKNVLWAVVILQCVILTATAAQRKPSARMAVTFDDLPLQRMETIPTAEYRRVAANLLAKLRAARVPAIGFVNEGKLRTNGEIDETKVDLLRQWLDAGLDLGNHTYSHLDLHAAGIQEYEDDILKGEASLRGLIKARGRELSYFRHPYLHTGLSLTVKEEIEDFLSRHGYTVAPVTIDNSEWIFAAAYEKAIARKESKMKAQIAADYLDYMKRMIAYWENQSMGLFGRNIDQILLIHANVLNSDHFDRLIRMIQERGYQFVPLSAVLKDPAYTSRDTAIQNAGISWIHRWAITQGKGKDFFEGEPKTPPYIMRYAGIDSE